MKISDILHSGKVTVSCELFPPKANSPLKLDEILSQTAQTAPDFISVTYGAGGSTSKSTLSIADQIQNTYHVPALAHMTCVSSTKTQVETMVADLQKAGISNILALRGDLPEDGQISSDYRYASDLVSHIRSLPGGNSLSIGAACYPEGHVECARRELDIEFLKAKVDCGVDFLTTQMFFDNNLFFNFLYKIREAGSTVPVVPGIMPITNANQVARAIQLSGSFMPQRFKSLVDKFGDNPKAMEQAGIAYATDQIIDLYANGIANVHVYSMNKPAVARKIQANLSEIIR